MMTPEQLQTAYTPTTAEVRARYRALTLEGQEETAGADFERWLIAHDAAIARQQAETDIEIAKSLVSLFRTARAQTKQAIEHAIRAQFPGETGR